MFLLLVTPPHQCFFNDKNHTQNCKKQKRNSALCVTYLQVPPGSHMYLKNKTKQQLFVSKVAINFAIVFKIDFQLKAVERRTKM